MINTLKKREDFVSLYSRGESIATKGLVLQYKNSNESYPARIGFTASKKIGGAVYRNKAKRRLRESVRFVSKYNPKLLKDGHDYNLIARYSTISRPFDSLIKDLKYALHQCK